MNFFKNKFQLFLFRAVFFTMALLVYRLAVINLSRKIIVLAFIAGLLFSGVVYYFENHHKKKQ